MNKVLERHEEMLLSRRGLPGCEHTERLGGFLEVKGFWDILLALLPKFLFHLALPELNHISINVTKRNQR